jgi:predicted TIM-barrel enzyme
MKFFAVVHVTSKDGYLPAVSVERAIQAGADGVFLINHGISPRDLLDVTERVHQAFPDVWIGVNLLGVAPEEAFHLLSPYIQGLWTDNAHVGSGRYDDITAFHRQKSQWVGQYFGGVAFKYQSQPKNLAAAVLEAVPCMEVITTSGPGTGHPPTVDKIRIMREALDSQPEPRGLAIASGITPENISQFMPYATHVLVATGVQKSFQELDLEKMRALVDAIKG